jgi:hypothetical protein
MFLGQQWNYVKPLLSHKKHHISSQNIAEYRKRKELIILDMKMNSVGISEVFHICGRRALAAIEPCISLTIHPEGGPPTIFDKRPTDFLSVICPRVN